MSTSLRFVLVNPPPYVDMDFEEAPKKEKEDEDDSDDDVANFSPETPIQKILAKELELSDFAQLLENSTKKQALDIMCSMMGEAIPQLIKYKIQVESLQAKFNSILVNDAPKNRRLKRFAKKEHEMGEKIQASRRELARLRKYVQDNSEGGFDVEIDEKTPRKSVTIQEPSSPYEEDNKSEKKKNMQYPKSPRSSYGGKHSDWSPKKYKKRSAQSSPKSQPEFQPYYMYPESENFTSGPLIIESADGPPPEKRRPLFEQLPEQPSSSSSTHSNYRPIPENFNLSSGPIIEEIFE